MLLGMGTGATDTLWLTYAVQESCSTQAQPLLRDAELQQKQLGKWRQRRCGRDDGSVSLQATTASSLGLLRGPKASGE